MGLNLLASILNLYTLRDGPHRKRRIVNVFKDRDREPNKKLAELKSGKLSEEERFEDEMADNYSEYCKPLVPCKRELRKVVFPDGKRWLQVLYPRMVDVFEKAKKDLTDQVARK